MIMEYFYIIQKKIDELNKRIKQFQINEMNNKELINSLKDQISTLKEKLQVLYVLYRMILNKITIQQIV